MTYKEMCEGCESKKCKSAGFARVREGKREDFRDVKGRAFSCVEKVCSTLWVIVRCDDIAKKNQHENDRLADERHRGCRTKR